MYFEPDDRLEGSVEYVSTESTEGVYRRATDMDIKHKRARDNQMVTCEDVFGRCGRRDRIQLDRLMAWAKPNGNGLDSVRLSNET